MKRLTLFTLLLLTPAFIINALTLNLSSSRNANINDAKQASPLPVSIFVLRANTRFNKSNYFTLEDNAHSHLGHDYISKQSKLLLPGSSSRVTVSSTSGANYIGIIAGYNSLKGKTWRQSISVKQLQRYDAHISFSNNGIRVRYSEKPALDRSALYVEGNLGYNIMSAKSNTFAYTSSNQAKFEINQQQQFGTLGMGVGYQWMRTRANWLDKLHLEKVSVGFGFYYTPMLKFSGRVLNFLQTPSKQTPRDFTLKSNSEQFMLQSKINFLRFSAFTTFINFGAGIQMFHNTYERQTSSMGGITLSKQSSTNDFLYTLGLGEAYDVDDKLSLGFGVQYNTPVKIKVDAIVTSSTPAQSNPSVTMNNLLVFFKMRYLV